jgi:hypothetical protein
MVLIKDFNCPHVAGIIKGLDLLFTCMYCKMIMHVLLPKSRYSSWHLLCPLCRYCCFQIPCVGLGDLCANYAKAKKKLLFFVNVMWVYCAIKIKNEFAFGDPCGGITHYGK